MRVKKYSMHACYCMLVYVFKKAAAAQLSSVILYWSFNNGLTLFLGSILILKSKKVLIFCVWYEQLGKVHNQTHQGPSRHCKSQSRCRVAPLKGCRLLWKLEQQCKQVSPSMHKAFKNCGVTRLALPPSFSKAVFSSRFVMSVALLNGSFHQPRIWFLLRIGFCYCGPKFVDKIVKQFQLIIIVSMNDFYFSIRFVFIRKKNTDEMNDKIVSSKWSDRNLLFAAIAL